MCPEVNGGRKKGMQGGSLKVPLCQANHFMWPWHVTSRDKWTKLIRIRTRIPLVTTECVVVTHVDDDPLAVVVVVLDRVEVVLARVLRVLVNALILVRAQLRQRPERRKGEQKSE